MNKDSNTWTRQMLTLAVGLMLLAGSRSAWAVANPVPVPVPAAPQGTAVPYDAVLNINVSPLLPVASKTARGIVEVNDSADVVGTNTRFAAPRGWFTVDVRDAAVLPGGKVWIVVRDGSKSIFSGCVTVAQPHRFNVPSKTASFSVLSTSIPVHCYGAATDGVAWVAT